MSLDSYRRRAMRVARIDPSAHHPLPSPVGLVVATILAVVVSLAADALVTFTGTRVFPSTVGYVHFRFADYATLTIIGVLVAGAAWPIVVRISPCPRWLFIRLAVVVTLVLWLPDLYLIVRGQPVRAVAVLMVMHLVIAVVTYNLLVRVAPPGHDDPPDPGAATSGTGRVGSSRLVDGEPGIRADRFTERSARRWAWALTLLVGLEFVVGIVTLVYVPTGRSSGWLPEVGRTVYLAHAALGFPLAIAAGAFLLRVRGSTRIYLLSAWIGGVGVAVAGAGGLLTVAHPLRLVGLALMFVGSVVAGFGYLLPAFDRLTEGEPVPEDD